MKPVAAGLVSSPEDYRWSSARAHLEGQDDKLVRVAPLLGIISDWKSYLRPSLNDEVDLIHRHERTGRPLGGPAFVGALEHKLRRILKPQKPGPKKRSSNR
jgi:putative transposase